MAEIADEIEVVVYLRDPRDLYVSQAQQRVKTFGEIRRPSPAGRPSYFAALEAISTEPLRPRLFSREALVGGDIVLDFARTFLPSGAEEILLSNRVDDLNTTMSAEAMAILQTFNKNMGFEGVESYDEVVARRLRARVQKIDTQLPGFTKPRSTPGVNEAIVRQDTSLRWLKGRYGFTFPGIDYAKAGRKSEWSRRRLSAIAHVRDFLRIDRAREHAMAEELADLSPVPLVEPHKWAYVRRLVF